MNPFEKYGNNQAPQQQKIPYMVDGVPQLDNMILPSDETIQGIKDRIKDRIKAFFDSLAFPEIKDPNPDLTERIKNFVFWCDEKEYKNLYYRNLPREVKIMRDFLEDAGSKEYEDLHYRNLPRKVKIMRDFLEAGGSFVSKKTRGGKLEIILINNEQECVLEEDELEYILSGKWFAIDRAPQQQKIPYMVDGVPQLDNMILPSDETIQGIKDRIKDRIKAFFDISVFPEIKDPNPDLTERIENFALLCDEKEYEDLHYRNLPRKVKIMRDFLEAGGSFVSKKTRGGKLEIILIRNGIIHNDQECVLEEDELEHILSKKWWYDYRCYGIDPLFKKRRLSNVELLWLQALRYLEEESKEEYEEYIEYAKRLLTYLKDKYQDEFPKGEIRILLDRFYAEFPDFPFDARVGDSQKIEVEISCVEKSYEDIKYIFRGVSARSGVITTGAIDIAILRKYHMSLQKRGINTSRIGKN